MVDVIINKNKIKNLINKLENKGKPIRVSKGYLNGLNDDLLDKVKKDAKRAISNDRNTVLEKDL